MHSTGSGGLSDLTYLDCITLTTVPVSATGWKDVSWLGKADGRGVICPNAVKLGFFCTAHTDQWILPRAVFFCCILHRLSSISVGGQEGGGGAVLIIFGANEIVTLQIRHN